MWGAIIGDIIGSVFEANPVKTTEFDLFTLNSTITDDTVMTVAVAEALINGSDFVSSFQKWGRRYPNAGYGGNFINWLFENDPKPYNSWGNGAAMRVSPVGWLAHNEVELLNLARRSAEVSHNHPEGIKGAKAVAMAIFDARRGLAKNDIKIHLQQLLGYDFDRSLDKIRADYHFDVSCQGSVPEAIIAFLESENFESAIRNAISLGGDADTQACIAGAIAEAYYGKIPEQIIDLAEERLPSDILSVCEMFYDKLRIS
mgnify:CR=1 FL=1